MPAHILISIKRQSLQQISETEEAKGHTLVVTNTDDKSETDGHIYTYYQCENCDYTTTEIQHISYVDGYYNLLFKYT